MKQIGLSNRIVRRSEVYTSTHCVITAGSFHFTLRIASGLLLLLIYTSCTNWSRKSSCASEMTSCSRVLVTPRAVFVSDAAAQSEGALHSTSPRYSLHSAAARDPEINKQTNKQTRHHTLLKVYWISKEFGSFCFPFSLFVLNSGRV